MDARTVTQWFLLAWVVVAVAYDTAVASWFGDRATISRVVFDWSQANPIIAFACGLIAAHWFWSQRG